MDILIRPKTKIVFKTPGYANARAGSNYVIVIEIVIDYAKMV